VASNKAREGVLPGTHKEKRGVPQKKAPDKKSEVILGFEKRKDDLLSRTTGGSRRSESTCLKTMPENRGGGLRGVR